jgi:THO complex subunit 4
MMQAQYRPLPYARLNSFHGPKRQLLGHKAGQAPPSWKIASDQVGAGLVSKGKTLQEQGSRIFLSRLPVDVGEKDVEVSDYYCFKHVTFDGFPLGAI